MNLKFATNEEIVHAARSNLAQGPWDYLIGGAESETTMRRNRMGFDRIGFRPRVLVDVSKVDPSTTFLGHPLRIPLLLAPVGALQVFYPEGAAASAKAAGEFGIMPVVSSSTEPALEVTAAASQGPKVFQLYVDGDRAWIRDILSRVKESGYNALCLTVDVAIYSKRERTLLSRWVSPSRQNPARNRDYRAAVTWEQMDEIKEFAGLPFMVKGIATAEDARIAVEHGVDVIWVSNHGGRQLDHGLGSIEVLPEVLEAVDGRADVIMDGGVTRGTDIIKAVAMGAKAVAIGKMQAMGLAAGGSEALLRMLQILEEEMMVSMGLMGLTNLSQLTKDYVREAHPTTLPHETSAWVNLPGRGGISWDGRLL